KRQRRSLEHIRHRSTPYKCDRLCYRTCRAPIFNPNRVLAAVRRSLNLTRQMDKPVMKSLVEFEDYLARHLAMARVMRKLSRDDEYLVRLDKLMGERWCSVVNCNSPTPEQRRAALEERENVSNLFLRVQPATKELLVRLHSLQA